MVFNEAAIGSERGGYGTLLIVGGGRVEIGSLLGSHIGIHLLPLGSRFGLGGIRGLSLDQRAERQQRSERDQ